MVHAASLITTDIYTTQSTMHRLSPWSDHHLKQSGVVLVVRLYRARHPYTTGCCAPSVVRIPRASACACMHSITTLHCRLAGHVLRVLLLMPSYVRAAQSPSTRIAATRLGRYEMSATKCRGDNFGVEFYGDSNQSNYILNFFFVCLASMHTTRV